MCWCRPEIRTPNCGRIGCYPPAGHMEEQAKKLLDPPRPVAPGFDEMIRDDETLQVFTAPPKDGDYDWHIMSAMRAVYRHMKKIMEDP